jgi:hypothetical protein
MATANLIQVGTRSPALATAKNDGITGGQAATGYANAANFGVGLNNSTGLLDSIPLTAGTWVVTGLVFANAVVPGVYLNSVSGTLANSWPVQQRTLTANSLYLISAVITVTTPTTVYLNGGILSLGIVQGFLTATQVG